jgi:hypothetical protein
VTRAAVLAELGAGAAAADELLACNANPFTLPGPGAPPLPLPDEPFVAAWAEYADDARRRGVVAVLRERLPQLRFPVTAGISETPEYQAAVRRGVLPDEGGPGLAFASPDGIHLDLVPTAAGRIPVLLFEQRADYVAALRAFTRRNEPAPVPDAQGALMVAGYNNWDRVARLRAAFERGALEAGEARTWAEAFPLLRERRELYQDAFILLSAGPYSGVPAGEMGMDAEAWRRLSVVIRREHECAHYFTRRVLGSMGGRLLDELMADYAGIAAAAGRFRADWFLRFMGLEHPADYRAGGRLESYRGTLSDDAFRVLQALVRRAAATLEAVDSTRDAEDGGAAGRTRMLLALAGFTLEELAAPDAADGLRSALACVPSLGLGEPAVAGAA